MCSLVILAHGASSPHRPFGVQPRTGRHCAAHAGTGPMWSITAALPMNRQWTGGGGGGGVGLLGRGLAPGSGCGCEVLQFKRAGRAGMVDGHSDVATVGPVPHLPPAAPIAGCHPGPAANNAVGVGVQYWPASGVGSVAGRDPSVGASRPHIQQEVATLGHHITERPRQLIFGEEVGRVRVAVEPGSSGRYLGPTPQAV